MPKQQPPETSDRYRIHGEVPIETFGFVLKELTKLGVLNIGYEIVTDVPIFKQRQTHEVGSSAFAAAWIAEHPTFEMRDLSLHFKASGRTTNAAYGAVNKLVAKKLVRKTGPGKYQLTDDKALPKGKKVTKTKRGQGRRYEVGNREFALSCFKNRTEISTEVLNGMFEKNGRPAKSVSAVLTKLGHEKYVKSMGGGVWKILAKGHKLNGAAPAAAEAANG